MRQIYNVSWQSDENTAVALGYFDGVHIAHQYLISEMKSYAQKNNLTKAIFTFTKSINLGHKGKDISSKTDKINLIENLGVDLYYCPDFSNFSEFTPEEFVDNILIKSMKAKAVFCGENFFFGKNRAGNVEILEALCKQKGIEFIKADTFYLEDEIVSSTAIRNALADADIQKANKMLGRPYSIRFEVQHGKKIGRTMGTPTINQIYPNDMCTPKEGVYISLTEVDGIKYPSATGFGNRPTLNNGTNFTSETYILGYDGDLYGQNIKVEFYKYLFKPQKFDNLDELGAMIMNSAIKAKDYFSALND